MDILNHIKRKKDSDYREVEIEKSKQIPKFYEADNKVCATRAMRKNRPLWFGV